MEQTQRRIMKVRKLVRTAARTHKKEVREKEEERRMEGGREKEEERNKILCGPRNDRERSSDGKTGAV